MIYIDDNVSNYYMDLYTLLAQRPKEANISHKEMPTYENHKYFVDNHPYLDWLIIKDEDQIVVGSVYITKQREIGISIYKHKQGKGYARAAIDVIRAKYPGPLLANINPQNERSIEFFNSLGFKHIQNTYQLDSVKLPDGMTIEDLKHARDVINDAPYTYTGE